LMLRLPLPTLFPYTTLFRSLFIPAGVKVLGEPWPSTSLRFDRALPPPIRLALPDLPALAGKPLGGALVVAGALEPSLGFVPLGIDRKSTRLNSSHVAISYAV